MTAVFDTAHEQKTAIKQGERTLEFAPRGVSLAEHEAMRIAFDLAGRGPADNENPRVGCVILDQFGIQIATGWHLGAGTAHAESMALAQLKSHAATAGENAPHSRPHTAIVTLEPCAHHGRTPSCSEALLDAGVQRVVYSVPDPTAMAGGGARVLRDAGVEVLGGVHIERGHALIADWHVRQERTARGQEIASSSVAPSAAPPAARSTASPAAPRIVAKWAMTLDGRCAAADGSSKWITSPTARAHAHAVRGTVDALVVGTGTALADNPRLTVRTTPDGAGPAQTPTLRQPLRVVVGERNIPLDSAVLESGSSVLRIRSHDPAALREALALNSVHTALVDGGPTLVGALIGSGEVNELHVYVAPKLLGSGRQAVGMLGVGSIGEALNFVTAEALMLGPDIFLRLLPSGSEAGCSASAGSQACSSIPASFAGSHSNSGLAVAASSELDRNTHAVAASSDSNPRATTAAQTTR